MSGIASVFFSLKSFNHAKHVCPNTITHHTFIHGQGKLRLNSDSRNVINTCTDVFCSNNEKLCNVVLNTHIFHK